MRNFLPIKGPGGRALTPKEKVALLVLGLTLVLCVLTLLAGSSAYDGTAARNPIFAVVGALCRLLGGGIVGLYALVLVWSGLIYFKGERIADISPIGGRVAAAFAVMVGISGALGIANTQTAGALGGLVGGAIGSTLGGTIGIILMLGLMALGINLAGQGAWFALREPAAVPTGYQMPATPFEASSDRMAGEPAMPEDGDPSPDERTHVVTQAMEEIERSQGVTIVDVEPTPQVEPETERATIGEEVESAPAPQPETEEAEIQRGLREVSAALLREEERERLQHEQEDVIHPLAPAPALEEDDEDDEPEKDPDILVAPQGEDDEDEDDPRYYEPSYEIIERRVDEQEETGFAATESAEDEDDEAVAPEAGVEPGVGDEETDESEDEDEDDEDADPYARGGLLRRLKGRQDASEPDPNRTYSSFDWRGRPID